MNIEIKVNDLTTHRLDDIWGRAGPKRAALMRTLGRRTEKSYRRWFFDRDRTNPNVKGWPRKHFWSEVGRRTAYVPGQTTDESAQVSITDPRIRLKIFGGTVRPREAKAIAIPLTAEAYSAGTPRAGRITDLAFVQAKNKQGEVIGYLGRWEAGGGVVLHYILMRSVTHRVDPQALPARAAVTAELNAEVAAFYRRQK